MDTFKQWVRNHPNLTAWIVLALGMVILLLIEARDVGLQPSQWFWLIVITILVAGAAIWIISWGDDEETAAVEDDNHTEISS
ncbi:MAG: hypothetical protein ACK2U5_19880 [Candidatus Promineifilaceae bacterium]|jgi:hypothetical protein